MYRRPPQGCTATPQSPAARRPGFFSCGNRAPGIPAAHVRQGGVSANDSRTCEEKPFPYAPCAAITRGDPPTMRGGKNGPAPPKPRRWAHAMLSDLRATCRVSRVRRGSDGTTTPSPSWQRYRPSLAAQPSSRVPVPPRAPLVSAPGSSSRSNSASAPKTGKIRLPRGHRINLLGDALETDAPLIQSGDHLDEVRERPSQPVESPDDEHIASADIGEGFVHSFPFGEYATGSIGESAFTTQRQ